MGYKTTASDRVRLGSRRRDTSKPKGRQVEADALTQVKKLLTGFRLDRDMLIEALHIIQDRIGHLKAEHLSAIGEMFKISQAEVFEVASFYHHFDVVKEGELPPAPITIRVCDSVSCMLAGAEKLIEKLNQKTDPKMVRVCRVPCIGRCATAPAANVGKCSVDSASVDQILRLTNRKITEDIPNYQALTEYISEGGYQVLSACTEGNLEKKTVINIMSDSGLRGMGGAGFPAGKKWSIVKSFPGPRLMTINGDEGEVGTFKDRFWLERQPHRMLEGALIAAWAVDCEKIYLYMRDEYPSVLEILRREIKALEIQGFCETVKIELRRGAGAYICGEESAMIESIEGKRGLPRQRPPYIAEVGLFGRPTLNHNIETLSWVPDIISKGAKWFSGQGKDGHVGLRSFSVSGRVKKPGVKVVGAGITLDDLVTNHCGGMLDGHTLKGFLPGGASGGVYPAEMAKLPLDFGTFEKFGGFIGSHAVIVLSEQDSVKDVVINLMKFFRHESCGQCTPCRVGTEKLVGLLEKKELNATLVGDLIKVMGDSSICGLGQAASNPVKQMVEYFPGDF